MAPAPLLVRPELPHSVRRCLEPSRPLNVLSLGEALWPHADGPLTPQASAPIFWEQHFTVQAGGPFETLIITSPEGRVQSHAKRRRWALTLATDTHNVPNMPLWCCMEFKRRAGEPLAAYKARVERELHHLSLFNRDIEIKDLLLSRDDVLLARMTNLPEEASHLLYELAQLDETTAIASHGRNSLFVSAVYSLFADVAHRLFTDYHLANFVHGDVKLPNIMLTDAGRPSIIDNGETRPLECDHQTQPLTSTYWPPEAHHGGRFGVAGDTFALGQSLLMAMSYLDEHRAPEGMHPLAHQQQVQARTTHVIEDMQRPDSSFYAWRKHRIEDSVRPRGPNHFLPGWHVYEASTQLFQAVAPEMFAHWLTRLVAPEPSARARLDETALLFVRQLHLQSEASREALAEHTQDILEMSKSNEIRPLLDDTAYHFARRAAA